MNDFNLFYFILSIFFWCCFCTCFCLCRTTANPNFEVATATHTLVTTTPQQYPQHPITIPGPSQSYQRVPYQPAPEHPGYPAKPGNPAVPMTTPLSHDPRPPPLYQDTAGPAYPLQPINQSSSQPESPLKHPAPLQPNDSTDFLTNSTYNPPIWLPLQTPPKSAAAQSPHLSWTFNVNAMTLSRLIKLMFLKFDMFTLVKSYLL